MSYVNLTTVENISGPAPVLAAKLAFVQTLFSSFACHLSDGTAS